MLMFRKFFQHEYIRYGASCFCAGLLGLGGSLSYSQVSFAETVQSEEALLPTNAPQLEPIQRLPKTAGRTVIRADMQDIVPTNLVTISVKGIELDGYPEVVKAELEKLLAPLKGKNVTVLEIEKGSHAVAEYLRDNGHPNAYVSVSKMPLKDGVLSMHIQGLNSLSAKEVPVTILVNSIEVTGTELASRDEFDVLLAEWRGKRLTFEQMNALPGLVSGLLRDKGYVLAQAWLPPQRVDTGVLNIIVIEGRIDKLSPGQGIQVIGAGKRINPELVRRFAAQGLAQDKPVMVAELDRALRLVNELPGVSSARSNLLPGTQPGTTQVNINLDQEALFSGIAWVDNYGSEYTGNARLNTRLNVNSPTGNGERYSIELGYAEGVELVTLTASTYSGYDGRRIGGAVSQMRLEIDPNVVPINLSSDSMVYSLYLEYPVVRSARHNQTLTSSLERKTLSNSTAAFDLDDREIFLLSMTESGNKVGVNGGQLAWNMRASIGSVDLSGEPGYQAVDAVTAQTEGNFIKLSFDVAQRVALSDRRWSVYSSLKSQLANKNLDGAEKFQLGGPAGVRAYPVGEGLGDYGWLFNVELRRALTPTRFGAFDVFGFIDAGGVRQYVTPWDEALSAGQYNRYTLAGTGLGVSLTAKQVSIAINFASKIGNNRSGNLTDADGQRDDYRVWAIGSVAF